MISKKMYQVFCYYNFCYDMMDKINIIFVFIEEMDDCDLKIVIGFMYQNFEYLF